MADVILISPPGSTAERLYSMCEAGGLSAALRVNGYRVKMIDGIHYLDNLQVIHKMIENENPILICFIFQWEHQPFMQWTQQLIELLRDCAPEIHRTAAGRGATVCYAGILNRYHFFNSIIRGESELTSVELIQKISEQKEWSVQRGIALRKNHTIILNESQHPIVDLDRLPFPESDFLLERNLYPVAPMYSSRYCYGTCTFCVNKVYRNATECHEYRARSAALVVDEMEMKRNKYNVRTFCFVDNNFFVDGKIGKERAIEIAEQLLKRGTKVRFHIESRTNDVEIELFSLLKRAGLRKVFLGIESGCQHILDRYQKGTTIEINRQAIHILEELGISWEPGFIMFDPLTRFSDLKQNLDFIKETKLNRCISSTGSPLFSSLNVYPGAPIEKHIPPNAWTRSDTDNGVLPYRILDEKVNIIRDLLMEYQSSIANQEHIYAQIYASFTAGMKNSKNLPEIQHDFREYTRKLGRWKNELAWLDLDIFDSVINSVDTLQNLNQSNLADLHALVQECVDNFNIKFFGKRFSHQIQELKETFAKYTAVG